jgi:hypothetical protein
MNLHYLLIKVSCGNEYLESRPHYAAIGIDKRFVDRMLADIKRVRAFKAHVDDSIYLLEFWDYSPEWIADLGDWEDRSLVVDLRGGSSDIMSCVDGGGVVLLSGKPPVNADDPGNRTECGTRLVGVDGIKWRAIAKHTDDTVDTATVDLETWKKVRDLLRKERDKP